MPDGKMPFDQWNEAAVICQIESKEGCGNAKAIAKVEGVGEFSGRCGAWMSPSHRACLTFWFAFFT